MDGVSGASEGDPDCRVRQKNRDDTTATPTTKTRLATRPSEASCCPVQSGAGPTIQASPAAVDWMAARGSTARVAAQPDPLGVSLGVLLQQQSWREWLVAAHFQSRKKTVALVGSHLRWTMLASVPLCQSVAFLTLD
ncbi:hypothetical protein GGTG_11733 [Gaeumannomyces tritici R3-111a-1]|uniref:Uncharacterized protein n=1 Tax=Gaeumannomyces tritici (strain R3-111a-1) TaxID=644352 RepID=J3PE10_GAET3|nr:hypothetical protein GGTG_11733 [Gaeumannomyces tritici R3-111a-1]EJT70710.1 hypothetical protein GGTG_11733 [Gaeumannomyces tritici R3-111a-1]